MVKGCEAKTARQGRFLKDQMAAISIGPIFIGAFPIFGEIINEKSNQGPDNDEEKKIPKVGIFLYLFLG